VDRKIYTYKFKQACQVADKIVAISRQTADDAIRYLNADAAKIEIIYQGCDSIFRQSPNAETLRRVQFKYHLPERFILAVGTIEERKNLLNLIRALPDIDTDTALVIVGKRTAYADVITTAIRELRLESRVQMIHNADFEDFPAIYKSSQALVYISVFEGFGLPVLEGLTVGVPVITSNISSMPEAGGDAALYIQPDQPGDIATQINAVLNDAVLAKSMVERGFIHAQRFNEEAMAKRYIEMYDGLLK
jgi:glycosyltransferase involved in cell wall biosynthesis